MQVSVSVRARFRYSRAACHPNVHARIAFPCFASLVLCWSKSKAIRAQSVTAPERTWQCAVCINILDCQFIYSFLYCSNLMACQQAIRHRARSQVQGRVAFGFSQWQFVSKLQLNRFNFDWRSLSAKFFRFQRSVGWPIMEFTHFRDNEYAQRGEITHCI